jgi:hypothetical protein
MIFFMGMSSGSGGAIKAAARCVAVPDRAAGRLASGPEKRPGAQC